MKIIGFIALIIVVPLLIDLFIFGNAFPSNIDNQAWAGFLGSYLGGIATLVAVFITISDNNKKIEEQKLYEQERIAEEKKAAVKPYLDTRYIFFNEDAEFGLNDRVFDIKDGIVDKVRYGLTSMDEKYIKMRQTVPSFVYLKYIIRNIGAGSAVNMQVNVNGFSEKITIAKDETVNLYMLISLGNEKSVPFNVLLDYWDVEKREASAEMAGNVMEAVYQQNGSIIDALSSTKYDDQRIARDLPVKVAHKIGDAYDFRHDVAIVYTNSPYVIAIFTDHSNYDTISNISKDIYEVLK